MSLYCAAPSPRKLDEGGARSVRFFGPQVLNPVASRPHPPPTHVAAADLRSTYIFRRQTSGGRNLLALKVFRLVSRKTSVFKAKRFVYSLFSQRAWG